MGAFISPGFFCGKLTRLSKSRRSMSKMWRGRLPAGTTSRGCELPLRTRAYFFVSLGQNRYLHPLSSTDNVLYTQRLSEVNHARRGACNSSLSRSCGFEGPDGSPTGSSHGWIGRATSAKDRISEALGVSSLSCPSGCRFGPMRFPVGGVARVGDRYRSCRCARAAQRRRARDKQCVRQARRGCPSVYCQVSCVWTADKA